MPPYFLCQLSWDSAENSIFMVTLIGFLSSEIIFKGYPLYKICPFEETLS